MVRIESNAPEIASELVALVELIERSPDLVEAVVDGFEGAIEFFEPLRLEVDGSPTASALECVRIRLEPSEALGRLMAAARARKGQFGVFVEQ